MKILLFVLIQIVANVIQAITGFAGGPLSMPPSMALVGVEASKAVITLIFVFAPALIVIQNRKYINPRQVVKMMAIMAFGFLPGLWLFNHLAAKPIMILYGIIVALIGLWKLIQSYREHKENENRFLGYVALVSSGLMQAMFTSGGPFMVIYASSAIKDKNEFRASVSVVWTILNILMVADMARQGMYTPFTIELFAWSIIPVFLAVYVGNRIANKINQKTFIKIVYLLLVISGAMLLMNALR